MRQRKHQPRFPVNQQFLSWLGGGYGRAALLSRLDKSLSPPVVSKMKTGDLPISFMHAWRICEAIRQKPDLPQLKPSALCSYEEDIALSKAIELRLSQ